MRFFGKDGVGKTDTSPLKIFIANLSMSLYWKETWDCKLQNSLGFTWFTKQKCIMAFGRGEGGKSLFRKTFGSLEKPPPSRPKEEIRFKQT